LRSQQQALQTTHQASSQQRQKPHAANAHAATSALPEHAQRIAAAAATRSKVLNLDYADYAYLMDENSNGLGDCQARFLFLIKIAFT